MAKRGPKPKPAAERFWAKVNLDASGGCWLWTAYTNPNGYGQFHVGSTTDGTRRRVLAHRWAYEALVGPIPDGLDLDHLCRVTACVNPAHLEPVTHAENMARGEGATKTECKWGHAYTDANTYRDSNGHRRCVMCGAATNAVYVATHRERLNAIRRARYAHNRKG